jgi:hypothetical protein
MTLRVFEGFENREPGGRAEMSYNAIAAPVFVTGRTSGTALTNNNTTSSSEAYVRFSHGLSSNSTFILSAAVKPTILINECTLMASDTGASFCGSLKIKATGQLVLAPSTGALATSAYSLTVDEWARVDFVIFQANAGGWMQAWVNGVMVAEVTGVDTLAGSTHTTGGVFSFSTGAARAGWNKLVIDDIYVTDTNGAAPYNGRLGDVRIESLVPDGPGTMFGDGWTPSTGFQNYPLIDELPSNDTDYVTSGVPGEWETFGLTNLAATYGSVLAVQPHYKAWKTDSGNVFLKPIMYTSVGPDLSQPSLGLGTAPVHLIGQVLTTEPGDGAWTIEKVNGLMLGMNASLT